MSTQILVVGGGAMGAFFASRLAHARNTVVSVACRSNYKAVLANGFSIDSWEYGSYVFHPKNTFSRPKEAARKDLGNGVWDYILVCTKALPDVNDDSALLEEIVSSETTIALMQNGVGIEEPYVRRFPDCPVLSAVTRTSCAQPSPGIIIHKAWNDIRLGPYFPTVDGTSKVMAQGKADRAKERTERLVEIFKDGGIENAEAYSHTRMQLSRWHKTSINAAMNPSGVLSGGTTNNAMAKESEMYIHLAEVMREMFDAAPKIFGEPIPSDLPSPEAILKGILKDTSGSQPSMQSDWDQGRRMELEVILGNPIRIARQNGLELPRVQTMYALLRKAQENRESLSKEKL